MTGEETWTLELDQKAHNGSSTVFVNDSVFSSTLGGNISLFQISQGMFFTECLPCSWSDERSQHTLALLSVFMSFGVIKPHCVIRSLYYRA